ncbi:MAG TPA: hypothetical protein VK203_12705 [Nostocaceae cyanobacterium]|nr:hypothetical protein [Nostocaceae cyanobacterium]
MTVKQWALLRKFLRAGDSFNKEVFNWYQDDDNNEDRKKVRDLLLIGAKDSIQTVQIKMRTFREVVQKTHLKPTIVGITKDNYDSDISYRPEIVIYFLQNKQSVPRGETPTDARVSFRLMNETSESITVSELKRWAQKIQAAFFNPIYKFRKGKVITWYIDKKNGFHLQIYGLNAAEGEKVARDVVKLADKTFDEDILKETNPKRSNTTSNGTIKILGKTKKKPKWRPSVVVEAAYAYALIHGEPNPIMLVDQTGLVVNPMIRDSD